MTDNRKTPERLKEQMPKADKRPYRMYNSLVSYYLFAMFGFFSFFLTNHYANARRDKYYLFLVLTGFLFISVVVAYIMHRSEDIASKSPDEIGFKAVLRSLTAADIGLISFYLCAVVSTLCSPYFTQVFNADHGRNNGLILLTAYLLVYFIITRMYVYKEYIILIYFISSCIVSLLTVLNYFYIDPLGIFNGYSKEQTILNFGSTIGNKNYIASYMAIFLSIALMMLVVTNFKEKRYMSVTAGVATGIGYIGALCSDSSSVLLGLAVAIPVGAIFAARSYDHLRRFFMGLTIMFGSGLILRLFSKCMGDHSKGFEFMNEFLIYHPAMYIFAGVCALIYLIMLLCRGKLSEHYPRRVMTWTLLSLTILAIGGLLGSIVYFSSVDTSTNLGSFERLLRFNDRWGTHRGFMWRKSLEEYSKYGIIGKLFGAGPDTALMVLEDHFAELLERFRDATTDCAHNEYINYLITQGALGLLSYLTVIIAVIVRAVRRAKYQPLIAVFACAVICYAVQATVNIYQPVTTPLFIIFVSITEAMNRRVQLPKKK